MTKYCANTEIYPFPKGPIFPISCPGINHIATVKCNDLDGSAGL